MDVVKDLSKGPPATKCLSDEKLHDIRLAAYESKQPYHNQVVKRHINWCQKQAKRLDFKKVMNLFDKR